MTQDILEAPAVIRSKILDFEKSMETIPGVKYGDTDYCPLKHSFADGIYVREIFIPKGTLIVGKIHKHSHPNFLLKGDVSVVTETNGIQRLIAPMSIISPAGTKRVVYANEDTVWVTVHLNPSGTQDLNELEDEVIAPSFEAYEKFLKESNETKSIEKDGEIWPG